MRPLLALMGQLTHVILMLDRDDYADQRAGTYGGSIGGHVRHSLDHITALLQGVSSGVIDYDHRERGTPVEREPAAAISEIGRLAEALRRLSRNQMDDDLTVLTMCASGDETMPWRSTLGRELMFVFSHTIHHAAMIAGIGRTMGYAVPEDFGLAPSTLAYRKH